MNFEIIQGTTFERRVELQNPDQSAVDLTGATASFCLSKNNALILEEDLSVTPASGRIDLLLPALTTSGLVAGNGYRYDLLVTYSGGAIDAVLSGKITVIEGVCLI